MAGVFLAIIFLAAIILSSPARQRRRAIAPPRPIKPRTFVSSDFVAAAESRNSAITKENRAAAYALGKTVAFLLHAPLGVFVVPMLQFLHRYEQISMRSRNALEVGVLLGVEALILGLVVRGSLPGSRRARAEAFNEHQLATGTTILSVLAWIVFGHTFVGGLIRIIVSVTVILSTLVYFIAKSVVSRSFRGAVLLVAVLPLLEIAYEMKALPPPVLRMCQAVVGP